MSRLESTDLAGQCIHYDLIATITHAEHSRDEACRAHYAACTLCLEEREALHAFFEADLSEEIVHMYSGVPLHVTRVAASLLDYLLPPPRWQRLFDDMRQQWTALGHVPFVDITGALARLEIQGTLRPGERPRYYVGQTITLQLRVDEDCEVRLLHLDSHGSVTQLFPQAGMPSVLHAGTHEFAGRITGNHDDVHRLMAVAAKGRLIAAERVTDRRGEEWVEALRQQVHTLPAGAWSWSEYAYRVAEPSHVSLDELEESCQMEIQDRADREKPACGEVCRRTLDGQRSAGQQREAFEVFYKITSRLVYRWIQTWFDDMPADQRGNVEEYVQEVYARLLAADVHYQGYFPLLRYLKEIVARVVFQAYRQQKRQIISAVRTKLQGLRFRPDRSVIVQELLACLRRHGLDDPLDQIVLEGLLKGQPVAELQVHPLVWDAFAHSQAKDFEKFVYNRRDTATWHAYKSMQKITRQANDRTCLDVLDQVMV